ncbi:unnamed protein product [Allacma fusca]|uniref:Alpha-1,3/1,6-mannosyltransferase ALG2 n=1 Tax=Allacma fusca TaxID=39272 RepID=A0A8J2KDP1_9HEXA|nr:unnamed protein product [Allacma fusca]
MISGYVQCRRRPPYTHTVCTPSIPSTRAETTSQRVDVDGVYGIIGDDLKSDLALHPRFLAPFSKLTTGVIVLGSGLKNLNRIGRTLKLKACPLPWSDGRPASMEHPKRRIAFIHPDLGLGGAERLIVDAAMGLKSRGYDVAIFTGYHDRNHAFPETVNGSLKVVSVGHWIPRSIFGRGVALMSYFKMTCTALYLHLFSFFMPDVVVCDQVSACIPFLKIPRLFFSYPQVLFYCHYPDQLLTTRQTFLKALYRKPLDFIEEITTSWADKIVVNSKFTRGVFSKTFTRIKITPDVLYPSINSNLFDEVLRSGTTEKSNLNLPNCRHLFVSLNRFEPKKNIALAIRAMTKLKSCLTGSDYWNDCHLVIAGGYDPRLESCVQYLEELKNLVQKEGLTNHVSFVLSPKDADKITLLSQCLALVYTPSEEHFGIVPLEAMYLGKPVIAVDSGGPRETVVDSSTGFLCPAIESHFGVAMARIVKDPKFAKSLGERGQTRFQNHFSFDEFSKAWDSVTSDLIIPNEPKNSTGNSHKHRD